MPSLPPETTPAEETWRALDPNATLRHLATSPEGLTTSEARRRLVRYGPNQLAEAPPPSFWSKLWEQFNNFVVWLLIVAAVVSAALGDWVEAAAIMAIVILNAVLGLVQESRATWARQGHDFSWSELARMALEAEPFRSIIDPNDESFLPPGDMPARIREYCRKTGQPEPETPAQIMRCALESLALRYRQTVDELERITGHPIEILHLVGGGSQNEALNQFAANAVNRPVVTGPVEATAIGNLVCQAMATGDIRNLEHARQVVRNSFETRKYLPQDTAAWEKAYARYRAMLGV